MRIAEYKKWGLLHVLLFLYLLVMLKLNTPSSYCNEIWIWESGACYKDYLKISTDNNDGDLLIRWPYLYSADTGECLGYVIVKTIDEMVLYIKKNPEFPDNTGLTLYCLE